MENGKTNRIVHVPRRFAQAEWGGTESVILNFCKQQINQGMLPEIHTSRALCHKPFEVWKDIPIHRYRYTYPFFGLSREEFDALDKKGGNLLSVELFWKLLRSTDVRIFHAHVLKRMGGAVFRAAQIKKRPFVVNLHGNVFDVPKDEAESVVAAQKGHFEWGKPFGMLFGSRQLLEKADAVICVGYSEYEAALSALTHKRIYHLPNGVNVDHFHSRDRDAFRKKLGLPDNAILVGCISRIDRQKNQELLLAAFNNLAQRYPELHLLLSGPITDPAYANKLEQASREGGYNDRIHIRPPVEPESNEHAALFASLDIFVLPSRHEPFGIVALEAWAAGKPLIVSQVGGLVHFVKDDCNGLTFANGDKCGLQSCLTKLIEDPALAKRLAEAGKATVQSRYSWKQIAAELENIYQQAEERYK